MIWITTLCLLAILAWLLFNGLNERRWVKAHSHDETVASDEGLFQSFSASTGTGSMNQGEGLVERTSRKVAATSENISQRVAAHAKNMSDGEGVFGNMGDKMSSGMSRARAGVSKAAEGGEDLVSRISNKVGSKIGEMDDKIKSRNNN